MIAIVATALALVYATAQWVALKGSYFATGLLPILLTIFVCFCLVCVFDAIFDRVSGRIKASKAGPSREVPKP